MEKKAQKTKSILLIALAICSVLIFCIVIAVVTIRSQRFALEKQYYGSPAAVLDTTVDEVQQLIDDKSSFAIFIYQPDCNASDKLSNIVQNFVIENRLSVLKISFSDFKKLSLGGQVRFYPSFVIIKKGEIVDFLSADNDEDVPRYTSLDGFTDWVSTYIVLENRKSQNE